MKHKYINSKQITILSVLLIMIVLMTIVHFDHSIYNVAVSFFIVVCGITFVPVIKKELGYSDNLQIFIYYAPMYIWAADRIHAAENYQVIQTNFVPYVVGIAGSTILIVLRYRDIKKNVGNPMNQLPIEKSFFFRQLMHISIAILAEEIYFSGYLVNALREYDLAVSAAVSAVLFLLAHIFNRWAASMFRFKDYVFILLLGLLKGAVYHNTNALWIVVIMHVIYNSSDIYIMFRRLFIKENQTVMFFNDY